MSDIFISYKRRLRPQVERIAGALRELGLDVWFDAALEPGVSFSAEISHEVRNAGCVLVCWSNDAFPHGGDENGWVLGEASIGRKRGRLVTVMLEELLAAGHKDAEYDAWLITIGKGDQFGSGFVEVNPNSKIPALRDHKPKGGGAPIR